MNKVKAYYVLSILGSIVLPFTAATMFFENFGNFLSNNFSLTALLIIFVPLGYFSEIWLYFNIGLLIYLIKKKKKDILVPAIFTGSEIIRILLYLSMAIPYWFSKKSSDNYSGLMLTAEINFGVQVIASLLIIFFSIKKLRK